MKTPLDILLPYQREYVDDKSRFVIGNWSRQTGKSFAVSAKHVRKRLQKPKTLSIMFSAGERQAIELLDKAKMWVEAFGLAIEEEIEDRDHSQALLNKKEIILPNGSRIIALPANPNTARGYSGDVVLDEFALHENSDEIWRAVYPTISNPLKGIFTLDIFSTPKGKANKYHDLWHNAKNYSRHKVDIYTAIKKGLPLDAQELKDGLNDPDGWAQEYECNFLDNASVLLPYDLMATCENKKLLSDDLDYDRLHASSNSFYLGVDIGRKKDLTAIWMVEKVDGLTITRGVKVFQKTAFREQEEFLHRILSRYPQIVKCAVDSTGIGAMLAENLATDFGGWRVEECHFTAPFKQEIFSPLPSYFQDRSLQIPADPVIREDLHAFQKVTTANGTVRYAAPSNEDGHSDRGTALALAMYASKCDYEVPGPMSGKGSRNSHPAGSSGRGRSLDG